jgi:hypothetical protein
MKRTLCSRAFRGETILSFLPRSADDSLLFSATLPKDEARILSCVTGRLQPWCVDQYNVKTDQCTSRTDLRCALDNMEKYISALSGYSVTFVREKKRRTIGNDGVLAHHSACQ